MKPVNRGLAGLVLAAATMPVVAKDVIEVRRMTLELAREVAAEAVTACRDKGYQVTAVVVDRAGDIQTTFRDTMAPRFTRPIAADKARAVILSGIPSGEFRRNRQDIRAEMNHVDGVLVLDGAVPIEAAGSLLGAVGVSGAPGGDKDAECARAGLEAVQGRLDFIQ